MSRAVLLIALDALNNSVRYNYCQWHQTIFWRHVIFCGVYTITESLGCQLATRRITAGPDFGRYNKRPKTANNTQNPKPQTLLKSARQKHNRSLRLKN